MLERRELYMSSLRSGRSRQSRECDEQRHEQGWADIEGPQAVYIAVNPTVNRANAAG